MHLNDENLRSRNTMSSDVFEYLQMQAQRGDKQAHLPF